MVIEPVRLLALNFIALAEENQGNRCRNNNDGSTSENAQQEIG